MYPITKNKVIRISEKIFSNFFWMSIFLGKVIKYENVFDLKILKYVGIMIVLLHVSISKFISYANTNCVVPWSH